MKITKREKKYRCRNCGIIFIDFISCKRKYCSDVCYYAKLQHNIHAKRNTRQLRTCLGVYCRGEKTFWSDWSGERQCTRCRVAIKSIYEDFAKPRERGR